MGKRLIIRGADFSANRIEVRRDFSYSVATGIKFYAITPAVNEVFRLNAEVSNYVERSGVSPGQAALVIAIFKKPAGSTEQGSLIMSRFCNSNRPYSTNYTFTSGDITEGYEYYIRLSETNLISGNMDGYFTIE